MKGSSLGLRSVINVTSTLETILHLKTHSPPTPGVHPDEATAGEQEVLLLTEDVPVVEADAPIIPWQHTRDCFKLMHKDYASYNPSAPQGHASPEGPQGKGRGTLFDPQKRFPTSPSISVGAVTIRAEEIGLVVVVLLLWIGAITLFINRWGKLRMLEPYQPQYTAPVAPIRAQPSQTPYININIQSTSALSLVDKPRNDYGWCEWGARADSPNCLEQFRGSVGIHGSLTPMQRSSSSLNVQPLSSQRRVRSAVDLVSLVMQEKMSQTQHFSATHV